jgi:hypothetical protein
MRQLGSHTRSLMRQYGVWSIGIRLLTMHPWNEREICMDHTQLLESANLPATKEYRMHDGKIEARMLGAGSGQKRESTNVSSEELSSHVMCDEAVAHWLERNLGWRRLLRAAVGEEQSEMDRQRNHQVHTCI